MVSLKMVSLKIVVQLIVLFGGILTTAQRFLPPQIFCATWDLTRRCVGGDSALISTDVRLTYSYTESGITKSGITRNLSGPNIVKNSETCKVYNLSYPGASNNSVTRVEFYFEQLEHGGGDCNCVWIYFNCSDANKLVIAAFIYIM